MSEVKPPPSDSNKSSVPPVSVVFTKPAADVSFLTGSPVDDSVPLPARPGHKLVDGNQPVSRLLKMTLARRQGREDEIRDILTRLIELLRSSCGVITTTAEYISPLNAEYYYAAAGHPGA